MSPMRYVLLVLVFLFAALGCGRKYCAEAEVCVKSKDAESPVAAEDR